MDAPDRVHIGVLLHDFRLGGTERIALRLAREWVAAGRRVTLLVGEDTGPLRAHVDPRLNVRIAPRCADWRGRDIRRLGRWAAQTAQQVGVSALFLPGNSYYKAIAALQQAGIALVAKLSNPLVRPDRSALRNLLFRRATARRLRHLRHLVVCSEGEASQLDSQLLLPHSPTVIANPVLDELPAGPVATKVPGQFCAVARLEPQKNIHLLLAAFARLRDLPLTLRIAGDGSLRRQLEARARALGIADRVEFLGTLPDVMPLLAQSEALLITSRYEGYCGACIEALAAGTHVIARDCSVALREVLRDPRIGTLVTEPTSRALSDAVRRFWQQRTFDVTAARAVAARSLIAPIARRYLQLLELPPRHLADLCGRSVWVMAKSYAASEGGMQTYARAVAETYAAAGARVCVFTSTPRGPRDFQDGALRIVDVGRSCPLDAPLRLYRALRREVARQAAPFLLHATTWRTSVVPMCMRLPFLTTFHGREFMYPRGISRLVMNLVARAARRVVAVSQYSATALARRIPDLAMPPLAAWNGVTAGLSPAREHTTAHAVPRVLTLCRLEPRKNLRAAIEAAATCRREGLRFHYTVAGRGEEFEYLRRLVVERGLEDVVEMAGYVDQQRAVALYRDADIFIHPHVTLDRGRDFEGFGIAIADAMYARTAVIAGFAGGSGELIEDGVSGLLVDGREQQEVTDALRRLLLDPALRQSLADAAMRRAAREFHWQRHVEQILAGLPAA